MILSASFDFEGVVNVCMHARHAMLYTVCFDLTNQCTGGSVDWGTRAVIELLLYEEARVF
jgi:hypothetical protein